MRIRLPTMNKPSLIGLLAGAGLVLGMMLLVPARIGVFFNIPGLLVVFGGTLAATVVSRPIADVMRVLRSLPELVRDTPLSADVEVKQLLLVADWYRRGNIFAADLELEKIRNPFLHGGIQMVIDAAPLQDLLKVLQWRIAGVRMRENADSQILRTMAALAPAFGMLGTLFGLVEMLSGLGHSGLQQIGTTMAFAMSATLYGILSANLVLKPLAIKMERRTQRRLVLMNMLQEGILLLYERRHPTLIRETLEAYLAHQQEASYPVIPLTLAKAV